MQKFRFYSFLFVFCFFPSPVCSGSLDETGTFKKWRGEVNSAQKEIEFRNFRLSDQFARIEKEKKSKSNNQEIKGEESQTNRTFGTELKPSSVIQLKSKPKEI
jgi:hypothetical protein